jgi:hypothetical protein
MNYKSILIILLSLFIFGSSNSFGQCEKLKKKRIYQMLGAAEYDNFKSTDIKKYDIEYKEEYQINLFKGVVYKMIFDVSSLPEGVVVKLVDLGKKRGAGMYEEVFNSSTAEKNKDGNFDVTMEFPQRKMMVIYEVPSNTKPGCVSFVLGCYYGNRIR